MKPVLRKNANPAAQRREQMLNDRRRSAVLRRAYPDVAQLRIELIFSDLSNHRPSPQQHTFYPPAPAYFRFACPCATCDADFDLMPVVAKLLEGPSGCERPATVSGQMSCHGIRLRDRTGSSPCSMQLKFQLVAAPANDGD
jgi:hypothetical protein